MRSHAFFTLALLLMSTTGAEAENGRQTLIFPLPAGTATKHSGSTFYDSEKQATYLYGTEAPEGWINYRGEVVHLACRSTGQTTYLERGSEFRHDCKAGKLTVSIAYKVTSSKEEIDRNSRISITAVLTAEDDKGKQVIPLHGDLQW